MTPEEEQRFQRHWEEIERLQQRLNFLLSLRVSSAERHTTIITRLDQQNTINNDLTEAILALKREVHDRTAAEDEREREWIFVVKQLGERIAVLSAEVGTKQAITDVSKTVAQAQDDAGKKIADAVGLAQAKATGPEFSFNLHPMCGGMPIDKAWESLQLYEDKVLPQLS